MFDKEFYPTPKSVIKKMLEPYLMKKRYGDHLPPELTILEPSAGKGNILDYISDLSSNSYDKKPSMYCCESNKELQYILQEKGYKLISEDFLKYSGDYYFDLIIMNPPFSNGEEHLLKAWEIMESGDIVCLLNEETIKNPYTKGRKLLAQIIADNNAAVEYLGDCFCIADRRTSVNVALVRLHKKATKSKLDFEFEQVTDEKEFELNEEILQDPVAINDVIGCMIIQYDKLKEYYVEYKKHEDGLRFYSNGLISEYADIIKLAEGSGNNRELYNKFTDAVKQEIWKIVLTQCGVEKYLTHKVMQNFTIFCQQQGAMDFTKENVYNIAKTLFLNRESILENAIEDVFDIFTKFHKENRCHVEGWKTNNKWKVNKKVILPRWVSYGEYSTAYDLKQTGGRFGVSYSNKYSDIDKVMCYLTGKDYNKCNTLYEALESKFHDLGNIRTGEKFDNTGESEYFNFKFWKKGTLHIEFKDKFLWEEFNLRACAGKNWLPEADRKQWEKRKKEKSNNLQDTSNVVYNQLLLT